MHATWYKSPVKLNRRWDFILAEAGGAILISLIAASAFLSIMMPHFSWR